MTEKEVPEKAGALPDTENEKDSGNPAPAKTELTGMTEAELTAWGKERGLPAFRGRQIFQWIHRGADFPEMTDLPAALRVLRERGWRVIASDLHGTDFYTHPDPGDRYVLVIGNEARGISDAVRTEADMLLKLPMRGGAESLNAAVAAGIMMYELTKQ